MVWFSLEPAVVSHGLVRSNHLLDTVRNFPLTWTMVTIITGITAPFSVIIDGVVLVLATVTDYSGSHYQCCLYYERIGWTAWVRRTYGMP